ncbi:MAG TPA: sigma-70 family RNA polymerase sigma factor [Chitinophagaceae bacterium]|nr:sigma-70 family RNA polymerase sigma factor [Chitinophagaceae bacterium]MCB9056911.1 sigma-70 family RNA polymerase sigma factor [Chitinophagales bacterium]HPG12249.1 sigma-70 family RNA polymerase sigma factor [Chitinophagaceae bacterium]
MEISRVLHDTELLSNIRQGIELNDMIRFIYKDHFQSLSWYVMNNSGSREDAEDIFQEVVVNFIDLVQKDKFRGDSSVKTFLFSLNRFTWLNELKRRGRAKLREEKFEKGQDRVDLDTSEYIAGRESKAMLQQLVGELGDDCRKILLLFYYENLSMKEILEQTHYENEQVVRNKKYKCLKRLEAMINEKPFLKQTLINLLNG